LKLVEESEEVEFTEDNKPMEKRLKGTT